MRVKSLVGWNNSHFSVAQRRGKSVEDVDAMCAKLTVREVSLLNGPMDRPWGVRTVSFMDPGGHIWEIAK